MESASEASIATELDANQAHALSAIKITATVIDNAAARDVRREYSALVAAA